MAISDFLKKDINRLVDQVGYTPTLPTLPDAIAIEAQQGAGFAVTSGTESTSGSSLVNEVWKEVITVYSSILVMEDGAHEKPSGWPTSGAYPSGTPLDINNSFYEQKRVHLVVYERTVNGKSSLVEQQLLVPLEAPYEGQKYQGVTGYGTFSVPLFMVTNTGGSSAASQRANELRSQGVQNG